MNVTYDFSGKTVLVTGGTSGIGLATARAFAEAGAQTVIASRRKASGENALEALGGEGAVEFLQVDVGSDESVSRLIAQCVDRFGKIDVAFNNAGMEPSGRSSLLTDTAEDDWQKVINTHLSGVFRCLKYEVDAMLLKKRGVVINMSSVYGLGADKVAYPSYVAAKHAVIGLTRSTAMQYAKKGIRINAVCPGVIRTAMLDRAINVNPDLESRFSKMHPMERLGLPEEVADGVLWLASDAARFVTGHALAIDGGIGARL